MTKKTTKKPRTEQQEITALLEEIYKKGLVGSDISAIAPEKLKRIQEVAAIGDKKREWRKSFAKNGHRFGTVTEAWDALRGISEARKADQYPDIDTLNWLASASDRCKTNDPARLLRELGFSVHGRHRTVNPDTVALRVNELIEGGASIMQACEQASYEIGCSVHAAYRWHRKVYNVKSDARRK